MSNIATIKGLTFAEYKEMKALKESIFKGQMFVEFTEGMLKSQACKRYAKLMKKKLNYFAEKFAQSKN